MSPPVGAGLPSADEAAALRSNFVWFAAQFAVNHGVVTTPLVISTSVLDSSVGYTGNALINIFTVASALLLGAPLVGFAGLKGAVLFGMGLYCIYAGLFCIAAFAQHTVVQWIAFCLGSTCGGIAAGVLWTAQGGYFARTVDLILVQEPEAERPVLSAKLAGTFAFLYLGFEVLAKLLWSLLDKVGVEGWIIAAIFTVIGTAACVLQTQCRALEAAPEPPAHWTAKVKAAVVVWKDPCVFLLGGMNMTFGFTAAFMNGYVNANYTSKQLGNFAVAMLAAFTALTAAVLARLFGPLSAYIGKGPLVFLGAICFACIPLCSSLLGCCEDWGWWLIVLYVLQGTGRAVYESTNKGVFADFFPRPTDSIGAFANVMLQTSTSFALCFFLSDHLPSKTLGAIVVALALLTPLGFLVAVQLRCTEQRRDNARLLAGAGSQQEGAAAAAESGPGQRK